MNNNVLTSKKQAKRNAILDEATMLLVEKPNASLTEIAEAAGIGIATLHRYVESREQLMIDLGLRAIEAVNETVRQVPLDEENCETYFPELIEALIPLGDKIYFLAHDASVNYNQDIDLANQKLREPVLYAISLLQQKGYFRPEIRKEWIIDVLYSLLFLTWQQIRTGHIAQKSAAALVIDTFYHGFKSANY